MPNLHDYGGYSTNTLAMEQMSSSSAVGDVVSDVKRLSAQAPYYATSTVRSISGDVSSASAVAYSASRTAFQDLLSVRNVIGRPA